MFGIPLKTKCWITEELSQGKHFRQMIFSRFIKFVSSLAANRRPMLKALCRIASNDIRSLTGMNLHTIKKETGKIIRPSITSHTELTSWLVYDIPEGQEWRLPLMISLLEIRDSNWEVLFDDEEEGLGQNIIQIFLDSICINR